MLLWMLKAHPVEQMATLACSLQPYVFICSYSPQTWLLSLTSSLERWRTGDWPLTERRASSTTPTGPQLQTNWLSPRSSLMSSHTRWLSKCCRHSLSVCTTREVSSNAAIRGYIAACGVGTDLILPFRRIKCCFCVQWFGNLVTMEWWNDLWLNEGFAKFMEFISLDLTYPELHVVRDIPAFSYFTIIYF